MQHCTKKLAGILTVASVCLCTVYLPLNANAQETSQEESSNIPIEAINTPNTPIPDISDVYPEVRQVEDIKREYVPNNRVREYNGESLNVDMISVYSETYAQELLQEGEMRWYGFILDQRSKASIMLQTVSDLNADIYLFKLNQDTYELSLTGGSAMTGPGLREYCSEVLEEGIYYFAVDAYEGSGQYKFAFYATQDTDNEVNDSVDTASEIGVNDTVKGVIDNPFDYDYYALTVSSSMIIEIAPNVGDYGYELLKPNGSDAYIISQKDDMYQLGAGVYYLVVYSKDGTYDAGTDYSIQLNKVANIADDKYSYCYMVNAKAGIVFQTDRNGQNMYVNGNTIDLSYSYNVDASNSEGRRRYEITMTTPSDLSAKIYQNQFIYEDVDDTIYFGMGMPNAVDYIKGTKGVGPKGKALEVSLYSSDAFYDIHCACSGAYAEDYYYKDLNFVTVFINPDTGKLIDIEHINYFYEIANGSDRLIYTKPYDSATKYYYPYYNGNEPTEW